MSCVVVMGVSGSGKTLIGSSLARELGWAFIDADDYHPESNRQKMAHGIALTDDDRFPWLRSIAGEVEAEGNRNRSVVLACSALKQQYRTRITVSGVRYAFIYLKGSRPLLEKRLKERKGHFLIRHYLRANFKPWRNPRMHCVSTSPRARSSS